MSSTLPILQQIAWLSLVLQTALVLMLMAIARLVGVDEPVLAAVVFYGAALFILRRAIPGSHRRGMMLFKREQFADAVLEFKRSYEFFSRHPGLDRFRAVTMLSASRISYREMALLNIAFCLSQLGDRAGAREGYKKVLTEFPGSKIAEAALRMLSSEGPEADPKFQT